MSKKVLIVDDDEFYRTILSDIVTGGGHVVVGVAEDGAEGLKKVKSLDADLIIVDLVMPTKNGIEMIEELRDDGITTDVIVCTSIKGETIVERAHSLDIKAYISKPFKEEAVLEIINAL
ncbi:MAG: response regulator [Deltaproteobacteria bacterium]|nr:response regulator [Deltaproteobacteria bacterium]